MKRLYPYLILSLLLVACEKGGGGQPPPPDPRDEVSQFEARAWDGVKRGGVCYEIFVRSFADSDGDGIGDLRGLTAKLDYLDELGIAAIWLMPIHPSPSWHGYDVEDYTAVHPDYGTMTDFEAMVARAHALDIRVVLDLVINHTSRSHPWFVGAASDVRAPGRDRYFFSDDPQTDIATGNVPMTVRYNAGEWHAAADGYRYMGVFSEWMPDLNYGPGESAASSAAFGAMVDAARFWLAKGVDGFRLDAVRHIYQDDLSDENPRFLSEFYGALRAIRPDVYLIGEMLAEHDRVAPYYRGLPALFDFSSWWRLQYAINNAHAKWYPKDLLDYRAEYRAVRPDPIQAVKLSNHDEDRTRTALGGDIRRAKLAAAVLLSAAGSPYIYYGEEIGMLGSKAAGDQNVREAMLWAPAARDTYRTRWRAPTFSTDATVGDAQTQRAQPGSIWRLYEKFLELRNTYPALAGGEMKLLAGFDNGPTDKHFMVFTREAAGEKLLVVHNVAPLTRTYTFPVAIRRPVADFGGVTMSADGRSAAMPAYTTLICEL